MMQTNILWTGREYHSLENCLIKTTHAGSEITSTIIGTYERKIYQVEYRIQTNPYWQTQVVEISSRHSNQHQSIRLENDGTGSWLRNGKRVDELMGCMDVDIALTPFTNSLPINRLKLEQGNEQVIDVIYIDLLAQRITRVQQKYTRLSSEEYHYENVPNDFEANIQVDEFGLVTDYPSLFVRTIAVTSDYPA
jgi:hypothetical protein